MSNLIYILNIDSGGRRLSEMLNRPFDVYQGGTCDQYLAGFMNQVSQAVDDSVSGEVCIERIHNLF